MPNKKCPKCEKNHVQKRGKRRGLQRYYCTECKSSFTSKKRTKINIRRIYTEGKQTQNQIAEKIGKSRKWVNQNLKKDVIFCEENRKIKPQKIVLIVDTTYFRQFGLMVFRSSNLKENLLWKIVGHESNEEYRSGIQFLMNNGWEIHGIVADGKPGLGNLFPWIPFQLCQFHQFQRVTQLISKNPKLEASKEFRKVQHKLRQITG